MEQNTDTKTKHHSSESALNNLVMPVYTIKQGYFGDATIIHKNGTAMKVIEVANELNTLAADIGMLLDLLSFDGDKAINLCKKHGGVGFMSDCVACKTVSEMTKRYDA